MFQRDWNHQSEKIFHIYVSLRQGIFYWEHDDQPIGSTDPVFRAVPCCVEGRTAEVSHETQRGGTF